MVAIFTGALSCFLPYLFMKTPMLLKKTVDDAMSYKEFVAILQSSLNATNSTREALIMTSQQDDLDPRKQQEQQEEERRRNDISVPILPPVEEPNLPLQKI